MHTSHLASRGLALAVVVALLGPGLLHDGAAAADSPAPKGFTLVDRTPSELAFSWSPVKGAAAYKLKMSTSASMTKPVYATSSDASEKISGLKAGQTYYAKVRVTDKKGVARSSYSSVVKTSTLATPTVPAQVLDLTNWKLTTPAKDSKGDALEVSQPALATYRNAAFFDIGPKGSGVLFTAAAGGATTSGSSYPRSELREMTGGGKTKAAWSNKSGVHTMTLTQAITAVPKVKPHVVAGQIHDADDDVMMIRLEGKRLFVESDGDEVGLLNASYVLGTTFTVKITASSSGIKVVYNDAKTVSLKNVGSGFYFKAGCYTQSNTSKGDAASAAGAVLVHALAVTHS
jgi:hypothetical protein